MIDQNEIKEIKSVVQTLLQKMTIEDFEVEIKIPEEKSNNNDVVFVNIDLKEPQFLIDQNGQTLFDIQRILKIVLNKKLKKVFYLELDINEYKEKKVAHLKNLAREAADQVVLTKEKKILPPMPAHERRIVHMELAQRKDIITESQGDQDQRHIIIAPVKSKDN